MSDAGRRRGGCVFDEVAELYERMRPTYPDELFADLASIAGIDDGFSVLEIGCGTGQATRSLAALRCSVTAVDPGPAMVALARQRLADVAAVQIEHATFEQWDDHGRSFDALVAAASWHWVEPALGWPKAHKVVRPGGWMALLGHVVVRRRGEAVLWYPTVQRFDGSSFADLLRTSSPYRRLEPSTREPLLEAISERIRTRMGDQATRRYLTVMRIGQRAS